MSDNAENLKVTVIINHVEFTMTYGEFCDQWDEITEQCNYEGTAGDWRLISMAIHQLFQEARERGTGLWFSEYKPYAIPPIAVRILG